MHILMYTQKTTHIYALFLYVDFFRHVKILTHFVGRPQFLRLTPILNDLRVDHCK